MGKHQLETLLSAARGLLTAVAVTLLLMALTAAVCLGPGLSDAWLRGINQLIKLIAIVAGAWMAIGRGGQRGFLTGMALASVYMIIGYALYVGLGGSAFDTAEMLGEILIGAAVGGIAGAILANLPPRARRRAGRRGA